MQVVVKIVVVVNLAKVFLKMANLFIQKHQRRTVTLIFEMNIVKMIFLEIANQASDIISKTIEFSPINTPGPVDCVREDSKPHHYFLYLFGEEFLDTIVADTNLYAERKTLEVHLNFVNGNLQVMKSC